LGTDFAYTVNDESVIFFKPVNKEKGIHLYLSQHSALFVRGDNIYQDRAYESIQDPRPKPDRTED